MIGLTRRHILAGAVAALTTPAWRGAAAMNEVDVAVVGAGAAGLAAAHELAAGGKSVVVVEARDRIGGRIHTDTALGLPFDAGASYIHWAEHNPWLAIARDRNVRLEQDAGGGAAPNLFAILSGALDHYDRAAPDQSFADFTADKPSLRAAAGALTRLSLGEDPERVSMADYEQLWAGDDYLLPDGFGTLAARYGADVPVRLSTPVEAIRWDGPGVAIETPRGSLAAAAAIVTVPVGVLAADAIRFTPPLPAPTQEAIHGLGMGALTKIALRLNGAGLGYLEATDLFEVGDAANPMNIELWPFDRDLAILYAGGDGARALCALGNDGAVAEALDLLAGIVGGEARRHFIAGRLAGWWLDPYARGSYSVARPGHLAARAALAVPLADKIWFAGEATAGGGAMTAGGALLEGRRAARAIVNRRAG
jgi:monoamine oxidase